MQLRFFINHRFERFYNRTIGHHRFGCFTKHIFELDVDGFNTIGLFEYKFHIISRFTNHVHRGTFTIGDTLHHFNFFFRNKNSHSLLTLVSYNFLSRKSWITDWQFAHIDMSSGSFNQFRQAIQVTAGTVVVNRYDGVVIRF